MTRKGVNAAEVLVIALAGVIVLTDACSYPEAMGTGVPGPGFFPRLVASLLLGCAGWMAFRWVRSRSTATSGADHVSELAEDSGNQAQWIRAGLVSGAWIATFLALAPIVGAEWAVAPFTAGLMWFARERSIPIVVCVPIGFAVILWLMFKVVLGVPLPGSGL